MESKNCFHCGLEISINEEIEFDEKKFCCNGCKTVYEIFSQNDMSCYYDFASSPGATPIDINGKYDFLKSEEIVGSLLEFNESDTAIVSLYIPHIHCSSCIWILENLQKLNSGISLSQVNFQEKKVRINYNSSKTSLFEIVELLSRIGYEPYISLENANKEVKPINRDLIYKIGIAFFCFGNIMLMSFPEYFEVKEFWLDQYRILFRWIIFLLALPTFLYSASDYYVSAYKSIKSGMLNIDVPIALGIIVMFVRSSSDMFFNHGQGFFDSMAGLIFFMLLGKLFQQKTYNFLSFERDYKSYFPIAITKIENNSTEKSISVYDIEKGDRLLIRNQELIPVDGILISNEASIDYSFVTGEAIPIHKNSGDKIFAGGKQIGNLIEMEVLFSVSQSYLTQLWSNDVFAKKAIQKHKTITDKISQYFTPILLIIAFVSLVFWLIVDASKAFTVFTAILIVACPCALALSAPFTLGNVLRIMGNRKFYLKNASIIEQLAKIDTIVFDKTGTLTKPEQSEIIQFGDFSDTEITQIKNVVRNSNHPLSRRLYEFLPNCELKSISNFQEIVSKGIQANIDGNEIKIGSAGFVAFNENENTAKQTRVYISFNGNNKGYFEFKNQYREGLEQLFKSLKNKYKLKILSGDNDGERESLERLVPKQTELVFNQKPEQKLNFIKSLQEKGNKVLMVGDGLNDAGALAQSDVGISISENINVFSPASDGILDASKFDKIGFYLNYSKNAMKTIYMSFGLSILYNIVGLLLAISGNLSPILAAILMPLSTITIVSFVTIMSNYFAQKKIIN